MCTDVTHINNPHCLYFIKVSPKKETPAGQPLCHIALKDKTTTCKLALFGDDALRVYKAGDIIKVTKTYRKDYGGVFLNTKPGSTVDVSIACRFKMSEIR